MAVVGSAEVVVRAITDKVRDDIQRAFRDARPAVQAAGRDAAKEFAGGFNQTLEQRLRPQLVSAMSRAAKDAAEAANDAFDENFNVAPEAESKGREAGEAFSRGVQAGASSGGGGGGMFSGLLSEMSAFDRESANAARGLNTLVFAANIGGAAVSGLVSSLSAAVSGLFAIGAAASQAAGALAVLPGAMSVAAQAAGTIKLGFMGIGDAVTEQLKPAGVAARTAANQAVSSSNAIADAQKALARATEQAARARADADRRVRDAVESVRDAERDLLSTTKELNAAREEAAESLQQLGFSAEGAALAEQRAALKLEDARARLAKVTGLPPDNRTRIEAELAFKEADLNYREAKDRNADLAKEQEKASKAGIEGSAEVLAVKEKIAKAEETVLDREKALSEARLQRQRAIRDSALSVADAQERVRRAVEASNRASAGNAASLADANTAYNSLSASGKAFVDELLRMREAFKGVGTSIQGAMLPPLTRAMETFRESGAIEIMRKELTVTGGIIGTIGEQFVKTFTAGPNLRRFQTLLRENNDILDTFTTKTEDGTTPVESLANLLLRVGRAIQPITKRFAEWTAGLITAADASDRFTQGKMVEFFEDAGDTAAQLGRIIGNIGEAIFNLGSAATPAGESLLNSFESATAKFEEFTQKLKDDGTAGRYFTDVADNLRAIGDLINVVVSEFVRLGDNKGVADLAKGLEPAVKNVAAIFDNFTSNGDSIAKFAEEITELVLNFTDSSGIQIFFDVLSGIIDKVNDLMGLPGVKQGLGIAAGAFAAVSALTFATDKLATFGRAISGTFLNARVQAGRLVTSIGAITKKIPGLKGLGEKIAGSGNKLGGGASDSGKKGADVDPSDLAPSSAAAEAFKDNMRELATQFKFTGEAKDAFIRNLQALSRQFAATGAAATGGAGAGAKKAAGGAAVAANLTPVAVGADKAASATGKAGKSAGILGRTFAKLGGAVKGIGRALMFLVGGPIGLVIAAVGLLVFGLVKLYQKSPEFKKFVDGIADGLKKVWDAIQPVVEAIGKWLLDVLNRFFKWVNANMPAIKGFFADVFNAIGGFITDIFMPAWNNFLLPAINRFWAVVQAVLPVVRSIFSGLFSAIKFYITKIFIPVWQRIFSVIRALWPVVRRIFTLVKNIISNVFRGIKLVWEKVLSPTVSRIRRGFGNIWEKVREVFNNIRTKFTDFKTRLEEVKTKVESVVTKIKTAFGGIGEAVQGAFGGLWGKVAPKLNTFIGFINKHLIGNINSVIGVFSDSLKISKIPTIKGFAQGGYTGHGSKYQPAGVVHADEFVIRKEARQKIEATHPGLLSRMNSKGEVDLPMGGIFGAIKNIGSAAWDGLGKVGSIAINGVSLVGDIASYIAEHGLGAALEKIIRGATGLMDGFGIKKGQFITDSIYAMMDRMADAAGSWSRNAGKGGDKTWKYPLGTRGPVTRELEHGYNAIDIGIPTGTAVKAITSGVVQNLRQGDGSVGYGIYTRMTHANGYGSLYGHLSRYAVRSGQRVNAGQTIGYSGNTGTSSGPHLHLEITKDGTKLVPSKFMKSKGISLFAKGGIARATDGGIPAIIAEAGKNERVEPLDTDGLSKRDKVILEQVANAAKSGGSRSESVVIHQNYYGPTTSGGRLKEIDWTIRYATKARSERWNGVAR